ncbi:MAG: hypothetical protein ABFD46_08125 [Armatimonadota bacterium]
MQVIGFVIENKEVIATFIISLIAVIKLTAWGKAQARALDAVVGVIERLGIREVKTGVASAQISLPTAARDALDDSVAKADPKKSPLTTGLKIVREMFRGL